MIAVARRVMPATHLMWPAVAASLGMVALGAGPAAVVPLLGVVALGFVLAAPLRWSAGALLALSLLVDNPSERPMEGHWKSPLLLPGEFLYLNLHKHTGIGALRFSALELVIGLLAGLMLVRKLRNDPLDDPLRLGDLPNPMKAGFVSMVGAVGWLMVYGLGRGGDFKNALWQVRQLFWLPVLGVLFGYAFKTPSARIWLIRIVIAVAYVRAWFGIYFYFAIGKPQGLVFEYVTTHSDSILAVVAILLAMMAGIASPSYHNILLNVLCQPVLFLGLVVNDRRLAFVSLGGGMMVAVLLAPPALQRALRRAVVLSIPLMIAYTAVGWNSNAGVFKPVGIIKSVTSQEDASSETRDIENYNLIHTLKRHPIGGSGFGHEYIELVQAYRVDHLFAQYKYIAHNSVLWIISLSGWLGFTFIWMAFPTGVLVALRVVRGATNTIDLLTGFGAITTILAFLLQAWGDMGLQSWMGTLLCSAFMGATGALLTSIEREREAA